MNFKQEHFIPKEFWLCFILLFIILENKRHGFNLISIYLATYYVQNIAIGTKKTKIYFLIINELTHSYKGDHIQTTVSKMRLCFFFPNKL